MGGGATLHQDPPALIGAPSYDGWYITVATGRYGIAFPLLARSFPHQDPAVCPPPGFFHDCACESARALVS